MSRVKYIFSYVNIFFSVFSYIFYKYSVFSYFLGFYRKQALIKITFPSYIGSMKTDFDKIDSKIICILQRDGRMPYREIAQKVGISETNVRTRVKNLLDKDIIQIVAVSDPARLGYDFDGNIKLKIENNKLDSILEKLKQIDEITYIALMTGTSDIDVDFIARSKKELDDLIFNKISRIEGVIDSEASLIIRYEKDVYTWKTALE